MDGYEEEGAREPTPSMWAVSTARRAVGARDQPHGEHVKGARA